MNDDNNNDTNKTEADFYDELYDMACSVEEEVAKFRREKYEAVVSFAKEHGLTLEMSLDNSIYLDGDGWYTSGC